MTYAAVAERKLRAVGFHTTFWIHSNQTARNAYFGPNASSTQT